MLGEAPCEDRGSGPAWENYWETFYDHYVGQYGFTGDAAAIARQTIDHNLAANCTDAESRRAAAGIRSNFLAKRPQSGGHPL